MMRRASVADIDAIRARLEACRLHTSDLPASNIDGPHLAAHGAMIVGLPRPSRPAMGARTRGRTARSCQGLQRPCAIKTKLKRGYGRFHP